MDRQNVQAGIDRRKLLQWSVAAAGIAMIPAAAAGRSARGFFASRQLKFGLGLYTLGDGVTKDLDGSLARIAAMGYREVELPNLLGHTPREIRAAADKAGLTVSSLQLPLLRNSMPKSLSLASEPARVEETMGELGAQWAVSPLLLLPKDFKPLPGEAFPKAIGRCVRAAGVDIWKETAHLLNDRASLLAKSGIRVGYHNHNLEFAPVGGTIGLDILLAELDPKLVQLELDIGWVAAAGYDPVKLLKRLHGRVSLVHIRDMARQTPVNFEIDMITVDIGTGIIPVRRVLDAAWAAGARHFFVEQEPPFKTSREDAARVAAEYLTKL